MIIMIKEKKITWRIFSHLYQSLLGKMFYDKGKKVHHNILQGTEKNVELFSCSYPGH